jgi:phosphocarrier protein HPr
MIERKLLIRTRLGLHARAAAKLVRLASGFQSQVRLWRVDGPGGIEVSADAKSILSVLMLAATQGIELHASAEGADEEAAMNAVVQLFAEGFGEMAPESSI